MDSKAHGLAYLGFGLYWVWVYLSFNYIQLTGTLPDGAPLIPILHIVSGLCGVATFAVVIALHHRMQRTRHLGALIWTACSVSAFGTLLYTVPMANASVACAMAGAVVTGISTPLLALAWGVAFCRLDARSSAVLTAGSFIVAGAGYEAVSCIPQPLAAIVVSFMPVLSAALLYACGPLDFGRGSQDRATSEGSTWRDFTGMLSDTGVGRVMVGLVATMFVCGGLRIYLMQIQESVYSDPLLLALPTVIVGGLFLVYGLRLSRTSLNLGPFYRMAMPLFALAFVLVALFGSANSSASFVIMTAAAALVDMLTWVLLVEIARSTRFSALLVMASGRLAIHLGMALGEIVGLNMSGSMTTFFIVSIVLLMVAMGYMFTDGATTFFFEPPTEEEVRRRVGRLDGEPDPASRATGADPQAHAESAGTEAFPARSPNADGAAAPAPGDRHSGGNAAQARAGSSAAVRPGDGTAADAASADGPFPAEAAEAEAPVDTLSRRISHLAEAYGLTPRETEVFTLWASGYGSKAIEEKLVLSASTVKTHLRHIYEKCDVHSRADIMELLDGQ